MLFSFYSTVPSNYHALAVINLFLLAFIHMGCGDQDRAGICRRLPAFFFENYAEYSQRTIFASLQFS